MILERAPRVRGRREWVPCASNSACSSAGDGLAPLLCASAVRVVRGRREWSSALLASRGAEELFSEILTGAESGGDVDGGEVDGGEVEGGEGMEEAEEEEDRCEAAEKLMEVDI